MSRLLADLHPMLQPICLAHQEAARHDPLLIARGFGPFLEETYRDNSAQLANWLKGRNNAGEVINAKEVVTNSRPGYSYHNVVYPDGRPAALAYHLALEHQGRLVGWPGGYPMDDEGYEALGKIGEGLGLVWGGRWKHPHDPCHYELRPNGATLSQVLAVMKMQGEIDDLLKA